MIRSDFQTTIIKMLYKTKMFVQTASYFT